MIRPSPALKEPGGGGRSSGPARRPALAGQRGDRIAPEPAGALSPASRPGHATGRPPFCAHPASGAVLPNPAGAQTSASPCTSPSLSASTRRRRGTKPGRRAGICSLVASRTSCLDTATPAGATADGSAVGDLPLSPASTLRPAAGPGHSRSLTLHSARGAATRPSAPSCPADASQDSTCLRTFG